MTQKTKEVRYTYFVSYSYVGGFGSCEIFIDKELDSFNDLNKVKESIEENNSEINNVIILNYIQLK